MRTEPATHPHADDVATVAEPAASRPLASGRPPELPSGASVGSRVTSAVTARETLHLQEIGRTRVFVLVSAAFGLLVLATLPVLGGDPAAKAVFAAGLAVIVSSCAWLGWLLRRDEAYTIARATTVAYLSIVGAFCGIWFFGAFSPAVMILPFGISFFSVGQSSRAVRAVYFTCAGLELLLMLGVITRLLPDRGIVRASGLARIDQAVVMLLVQVTLFATFVVQRRTRDATLYAIEQHDRVVRSLSQRDALLLEARQDLAQALDAGGMGRWSDQRVGSFRLGRVLGRGAMGEVYEATHEGTQEPAAVKLLHPHALAQRDLVQRFVREARIVASLSASNVVRVLEVSPIDAPLPYLAMERLVGIDLADHLREHKRLGVREVATMLRQVAAGLEAAHAAGVVHRDLKPRNLFLVRPQQLWKVLDFGVARLTGEETLTVDQIVGTPNYMAPEQARGAAVTHRSDLFSMGVIAYRALTGRPAFEGQTTAEIVYKVVHEMPPRPTQLVALHPDVDLALALAMAKDPGDRFGSAPELATGIEAAARGHLDPALRDRAARVLARHPWGAG